MSHILASNSWQTPYPPIDVAALCLIFCFIQCGPLRFLQVSHLLLQFSNQLGSVQFLLDHLYMVEDLHRS